MGKRGDRDLEEPTPDTDEDEEEGGRGARRGCLRVALFTLAASALSASLLAATAGALWAPEAPPDAPFSGLLLLLCALLGERCLLLTAEAFGLKVWVALLACLRAASAALGAALLLAPAPQGAVDAAAGASAAAAAGAPSEDAAPPAPVDTTIVWYAALSAVVAGLQLVAPSPARPRRPPRWARGAPTCEQSLVLLTIAAGA
ncbi:unnamed protein product, partial [Prorocentrum cordatum]